MKAHFQKRIIQRQKLMAQVAAILVCHILFSSLELLILRIDLHHIYQVIYNHKTPA
jgi:hypothetical protein